jgi:hypothetical protein
MARKMAFRFAVKRIDPVLDLREVARSRQLPYTRCVVIEGTGEE